jgi:hypothetical protein
MKRALVLVLFLALVACPAVADSIVLQVGGTGFTQVLLSGDAAAVAFTLGSDASNLTFTVPITCSGCSAVAWLTDGLDAAFHSNNLITAAGISSQTAFTGINLTAGTYFLVISNDAGALLWNGGTSVIVTGLPSDNRVADFFADTTVPIAPGSRFSVITNGSLDYSITQPEATTVPEPSTFGMLLLGLAGMRLRRI